MEVPSNTTRRSLRRGRRHGAWPIRVNCPASARCTLDDALAIRAGVDDEPRLVVVGGEFIGAEVAARARRRGLTVTMIEALPVPLSRGLGIGWLAGLTCTPDTVWSCGAA